ncbi:hypothetical protein F4821DRAFT_113156 [Hypoxylon rubiginosum]|uniref:Uncharacterized protein n=1 Tax=Hypoxylon rubiginosum TaxID=110542 RepID=A0ACC0DJH2_9PEZI|nr:hypothetical protein F4821DRAFT_113156 [Hypoxylon rubiginosum]
MYSMTAPEVSIIEVIFCLLTCGGYSLQLIAPISNFRLCPTTTELFLVGSLHTCLLVLLMASFALSGLPTGGNDGFFLEGFVFLQCRR